jgi:hypothetical protein
LPAFWAEAGVVEDSVRSPAFLGGGGGGGLDGDTLQVVSKILPLLSTFRQEDNNTRLLHALRPLLGPERQKKVDEAIKMLSMLRLLPVLRGQGIL